MAARAVRRASAWAALATVGALPLSAGVAVVVPGEARAQAQPGDAVILDARDALRRKDRERLALDKAQAAAARHPLAMWVDYWELQNRIGEVQQPEVEAFSARWRDTYVEDRFRNDWLLELGKRRDWANFASEYPKFRMNDDREVSCYALVVDQGNGKDVREAAMKAWLAQKDADDGCALLAATLADAKQFEAADLWKKARHAIDAGRPRAARQAVVIVGKEPGAAAGELIDSPARYLARKGSAANRTQSELTALALMRMANNDPDAAASLMNDRWDRALPGDLSAWVWASIAKQAAQKLQPDAADLFQKAQQRAGRAKDDIDMPDDLLAWKVRAALRADNGRPRWQQVIQAVDAMDTAEQRDPAWVYWKARALLTVAPASQDGESMRVMAREQLATIADGLHFYGALAAEQLQQPAALPPRPAPLTPAEREAAARHPGLVRALQLIAIGLRGEGVREWNYSLRGMGDRELLAAAQLACDREVWDRCINTSDRTKTEIDLEQRYPMPFKREVVAKAQEVGLDPAYVYGLIRQESRFIMDARSHVGASGLMQIMPATARWTAKKIGLPYTNDMIADRDTNLRLGMAYLKLVLDDFQGSQPLAAAAYNAGPGRPRKWRDGPLLEPAIWAENIPFPETRDYVKKVISNGSYYAALMNNGPVLVKPRLGRAIQPAGADSPLDKDLP